jgi:hypothetical protein
MTKKEPETGCFGRYASWSETGADAIDDLTAEDLQESAKRAAEKMVAPGN